MLLLVLTLLFMLWAAGWGSAWLALRHYGRHAQTRKSRIALHTFLLFHEPIHGLQRALRDVQGILREIRTRKGTRQRTPLR